MKSIFKTTDIAHPGVQMVMQQGDVNLAGAVQVLTKADSPKVRRAVHDPAETRAFARARLVARRGVPDPQSDASLARISREDRGRGLRRRSRAFVARQPEARRHSRRDVRRGDRVLIDRYFRAGTVCRRAIRSTCDTRVRARRCCTRCSVRTTDARIRFSAATTLGVGSYYGPFEAHRIFDEIPRDALAIEPMKIDWTFWCYKCAGMASARTCPHDDADRLLVSGTKLRKWLSEGSDVPPEFSRPEVLDILRRYCKYRCGGSRRSQTCGSLHSAR